MLQLLKTRQELLELAYVRLRNVLEAPPIDTTTIVLQKRIRCGSNLSAMILADECHCSRARVSQILSQYEIELQNEQKEFLKKKKIA